MSSIEACNSRLWNSHSRAALAILEDFVRFDKSRYQPRQFFGGTFGRASTLKGSILGPRTFDTELKVQGDLTYPKPG